MKTGRETVDPGDQDRTVAIEVSGVSKRFRKHSEPAKTLKERLLTMRRSTTEDFYALDGVDFKVMAGETFGILGHNGSGKSTLLKTIAGTIRPSEGMVRVRGRLSALLELGAGFHPDLTGRENVYLNGSILGFSRNRIDEILDDIVDFSGLADFIDTQVKHYSSGMYARLGFAVAVNLEPDVLLIDEVLAVGDEAFQRKCIDRIHGFQRDGRTICLVTHSPEQVKALCDRALVLDHGRMIHVGDVDDAVITYRGSLGETNVTMHGTVDGGGPSPVAARIEDVWVEPPPDGRRTFQPSDTLTVGMRFSADAELPLKARFALHRNDGSLMVNIASDDLLDGDDLLASPESSEATLTIDDLPFGFGTYLVTCFLQSTDETIEFDARVACCEFDVVHPGVYYGPFRFPMRGATDAPRRTPLPTARSG